MNKPTQGASNDLGTLAENARALLAATADVAGEEIGKARQRLAAALEDGKEFYSRVREKAVEGAKVADQTVRENPYQAIAMGIGVGAVIGYFVSSRCQCNRD